MVASARKVGRGGVGGKNHWSIGGTEALRKQARTGMGSRRLWLLVLLPVLFHRARVPGGTPGGLGLAVGE